MAASLLQAAHREVIAIDDEFGRAAGVGLPVVREPMAQEPVVREPVVQKSVVPPHVVSKPGRLAAAQSSGGRLRTSTVPL